jgi:hypothetical protein
MSEGNGLWHKGYIRKWSLKRAFSFVWPKRNKSVQNYETRVDFLAVEPQNDVFNNVFFFLMKKDEIIEDQTNHL